MAAHCSGSSWKQSPAGLASRYIYLAGAFEGLTKLLRRAEDAWAKKQSYKFEAQRLSIYRGCPIKLDWSLQFVQKVDNVTISGSEQESGKLCILRGFLKNQEFGLGCG
jgi:hypothetical protein